MENGTESSVITRQTSDAADLPSQNPEHQAGRLELATRLLVGLLSSGSGELLRRVPGFRESRGSINA